MIFTDNYKQQDEEVALDVELKQNIEKPMEEYSKGEYLLLMKYSRPVKIMFEIRFSESAGKYLKRLEAHYLAILT
ncbi:hypothetical protein [Oceanobacillus caeni]|uniref:Uncharacterized protein n=1 Tax=Oceanobacillus caeni TaxID=405946 RepID=A0ABR5MMX5_9BACI|nr:hypothetical protein [Oceanobacillus caeni]KPH78397.1 hypothetical protein AFL42_01405 [Oceanobacillus caeni]MBU8789196.1 hypothetical protein [Oceanobacillus caeni]MED4474872.1 hypothetical protein [Oceanobacillus caeni]